MTEHDPLLAEGADAPGRVPLAVRHPPLVAIGAGAIGAAIALLAALGMAIDNGRQFAFDRAVLLALRHGSLHGAPIGPAWFHQVMVDVTALGGETVLVLLVAVVAGFLAVRRLWLTMLLVLGGTITGSLCVGAVKALVGRPRPTVTDHLVEVGSASFPSGHAANSAIVYLTLATLIVQIVEERAARIYILSLAALLVLAIGFSRLYLGVHWPSDVLAGWSFGVLWATAWWAIGAWCRLRRAKAS